MSMIITDEKRIQILSYIVHAWEILQETNHFPKKKYTYAYVPTWPELYTGTLKAWWYLFLDKNIKEIVFVVEQHNYPNEIIYYGKEDEFLIWWSIIKNKKNINSKTEEITRELFDQLLYLRILTKIETVSMIGMWSKIKINTLQKEISSLWYSDCWIVLLWKTGEEKSDKKEDIAMIEHILTKKIYKKNNDRLGNIFIWIAKTYRRKPELVAYIHSSEIGIKTIPQIWYMCMVA